MMKTGNKLVPAIIVIPLCLQFLFPLSASESYPIKRFDIRPAVCVIEEDADCHSRFVFSWDLAYSTRVCLKSQLNQEYLVCDNKLSVEIELVVKISENNLYDLIPDTYSHQRVSRMIEVQRLNKDVRILNRRIWSVF
jgi:hypothetical protein